MPWPAAVPRACCLGQQTSRSASGRPHCRSTQAMLALWEITTELLAPFFLIALRQTLWRSEVTAAQTQVERRIREVATVYEIGQAMDKVEIDRLLDMITEKAAAVMEAQACSLLLRLPESDSLVIAASYGLPDDVVENARIFVGSSIAGRVVETGEPLLLNSLADDPAVPGSSVHSIPDVVFLHLYADEGRKRDGVGGAVHSPQRGRCAAVHRGRPAAVHHLRDPGRTGDQQCPALREAEP